MYSVFRHVLNPNISHFIHTSILRLKISATQYTSVLNIMPGSNTGIDMKYMYRFPPVYL